MTRAAEIGADATADRGERCAACDAPLADDQRFCLACGLRCAPDELRLAALPAIGVAASPSLGPVVALPRRPVVRSAAITAVVVLTMGIAIGATLGPATVGQTAAAQPPLLVVSAPPAAAKPPVDGESPDAEAGSAAVTPADEVVELEPSAGTAEPPAEPAVVTPADPAPTDATPPAEEEPPAAAPPADARRLAGVVLAAGADRFTLAGRDGALLAVHAPGCGVAVGDDLHLRAWPLANGTWAADRVRRLPASASRLAAAGTVGWVDPAGGRYALGARGTTLVVALPPASPPTPTDPAATTPAPSPPAPVLPAVGERVRVALDLPALWPDGAPASPLVERLRTPLPPAADPAAPPAPLELRGRITAVDSQAHTLALALVADDAATTVTLTAPATIALTAVFPGQDVAATAAYDGAAYRLTGLSPDGDATAADDAAATQGDQTPARVPGGDEVPAVPAACEPLGSREVP